jgi:DNA-binding beta-propeller fold protein YncE
MALALSASVALGLLLLCALASAAQAAPTAVYGKIGEFGETGSGSGQFVEPQRIAVDPVTGDVLVADSGNHRIEVFQPTATGASYLLQFGSAVLNQPMGVAVDPENGDVYVSDRGLNEILKFAPDNRANPTEFTRVPSAEFTSPSQGEGAEQIGSFGEISGGGVSEGGLDIDPMPGGQAGDGTSGTHDLLVADPGRKLVERFDSKGEFLESWDGSTSGEAFSRPVDLAANSSGDVIVADLNEASGNLRFLRFSGTGAYEATLGPVPNPFAFFTSAVLAADVATDQVFITSATLGPLTGSPPGQVYRFSGPSGSPPDSEIDHFGCGSGCEGFEGVFFGAAAQPAVGTMHDRLYVLATNSVFGGIPVIQAFELMTPPEVTIEPVDVGCVTDSTACFSGDVNPEGAELDACRFEVVKQSDPQGFASAQTEKLPCVPGPAGIGSGKGFVEVQADATALEPNTAYRVRLLADRAAITVTDEAPPFHTLAAPPTLNAEKAWSVTDTSATLAATVNPRNSEVSDCHFEWGASESYDNEAPCSPAPGSANEAVPVTAEIGELSHDTTYHFRIVADNGTGGPQAGEDASFQTRTPVVFPQRGYELVSAFDTNGVEVSPDLAAADGEHFAYTSPLIPLPGAENGGPSYFRAWRNPDGSWSQQFVGALLSRPGAAEVNLNSAPLYSANDLSHVVWSSAAPIDPEDENGVGDVYLRNANDGSIAWLSCTPPEPLTSPTCPPPGPPQTDPALAQDVEYVSPDGSRVLFASRRRLLPADVAGTCGFYPCESLYEWDEGQLSLVGVRPGTTEGLTDGSSLGSTKNRRDTGGENAYGNDVVRNAVSRDGTRIVFQSYAEETTQRLYVRIGGEKTVEASASAPGAPSIAAPKNVDYWGADTGDESVFFTSASPLTADSSAPDTTIDPATGVGGSADLYRYLVPADGDPAHGQLVDLTPHAGGAGVLQVLAVSDDGHRVYFLANGALTAGAQPGDCQGSNNVVSGTCNLYLAELGGPGDPVALTLVSRGSITLGNASNIGIPRASEKLRQAVADPAGSVLAFLSADALVPGRQTGGHSQVYVYDAARDELSCASCPPDGSIPSAFASLTTTMFSTSYLVGLNSEIHNGVPHMRNAIADGAVFFQTANSLVSSDSNGKVDVYEWRGGKVHLISPAGSVESVFADASADGSTVFFDTASQVLRGIPGGVRRVYAARVGVPDWEPPLPPPPCGGEDCKPVASAQPNYAAPSTSTILGRGNVVEPRLRCGRDKVRRQGKCLKRNHKRAHRRHHKRQRRANLSRGAGR